MRALLLSALVATFVASACSSETEPPPGNGGDGGGTCTPGQQVPCSCPIQGKGAQTCNPDGKGFGACVGCGLGADGAGGGKDTGAEAGADGGDTACAQKPDLAACSTCCSDHHPAGYSVFCGTV